MQAHIFIAQSIDSFIADKNGSIDFLKIAELDDEDYGYKNFMSKIDCLVLGRNTWETIKAFEFWPYEGKKVIVMSKNVHTPVHDESFFCQCILTLWNQLEKEKINNIYVDGGQLIQSFLQENLISTMTLTTLPILLGGGTRLFGNLPIPLSCSLTGQLSYSNGVNQSQYSLKPSQ